ncbi:DUF2510 domain-containing protein [Nocardia sp. NPDC058658]|uniref:DUF2510 domain-containing protein n=1 Tax=Nocardia sp. NPDC058658 TaxID=3346580 RepID=UPI0036611A10
MSPETVHAGLNRRRSMRMVGAVLLLIGFVVLIVPLKAYSPYDGDPWGCGNGFASNYGGAAGDTAGSIYGYDAIYDLPITPPPMANPGGDTALEQCMSKLARNRAIGYPLLILGIALIIGAFAVRHDSTFPSTTQRSNSMEPGPADRRRSDPAHKATHGTNTALPAGWYPDQRDITLSRWFDGEQWTEATLPRTQP